MLFFFKKPKIVVDCFTCRDVVYKLHPINYTNKFVPEYWKKLPATIKLKADPDPQVKTYLEAPTLKRCVGIVNYFSNGFVIPSWTDFTLEDAGTRLFTTDTMFNLKVEHHIRPTYGDELYKDYVHAKVVPPWLIEEKTGIKFTWNQFDWTENINADFRILSGIVDYKINHSANINMFFKKKTIINVKAGEPLVHIVPLTEKEVDLRVHLIPEAEYAERWNKFSVRSSALGHYREMQEYYKNQETKNKCPFGFLHK